ncbi:MAG: DNA recombination protein RmuC [Desulfobulbus propionicus]|nr:MAG: DNA recombination protein RmuC [Desulfobulbus propionicus]PIE64005.1 MAG: DNA recombination protein RmuC [Desulfobacterales bacterium]
MNLKNDASSAGVSHTNYHHFPLSELILHFQQLDLVTLCIGVAAGLLCTPLIALLFTARLRKKLLVSELKTEQLFKASTEQEAAIQQLRNERDTFRHHYETLGREHAALGARYSGLKNQLDERDSVLQATWRQIEQRFELLAGEILTEKSGLINQQHESALKLLLSPFHDQLQEFQRRVDDVYDREARDRVAITKEIQQLRQLNEQLSRDAVNLTEALQGKNKLQGQWGEMLLEKILEDSGLRKDMEYSVQHTLQTSSGKRRQPDAIVHLPGQRDIIIDAKVSLTAFTRAYTAANPQQQQHYNAQHLESVKRHIAGLSAKQYQQLEGITTLDFVLLFIPVEAAFQLALELDQNLLSAASRKQIILCSPSNLMAILRAIHHLWRLDEQNRNSLIIAKQAGNLYDKFVGFIESFEDIGARLNQSQQAWQLARKRLSTGKGNLITRTQQLKKLGVQTEKELMVQQQNTVKQGESS